MRVLTASTESVAEAVRILDTGGVVVIPTETVYGLGASIGAEQAVRRVFEIKGRPLENPLIVHIADVAELSQVAQTVPESAWSLAKRFWPGPLTLVLEKRSEVPDLVTGGGPTVAVRLPGHAIARDLIRRTQSPIAAPSANRFMQLSPTRVEHIDPFIAERVDLILDDGPCTIGIESTVVDCTGPKAKILRPGMISSKQISEVVDLVESNEEGHHRSPGMYARHYAPQTSLRITGRLLPDEFGLTFAEPANPNQVKMSTDPARFAIELYAALHFLDGLDLPEIVVEAPPQNPSWRGIWDRLLKAAH
jgi:L-threonylcarbamoyladenylate synthase